MGNQPGNQVSRNDKEDVHAHVSPRKRGNTQVAQDNEGDREGPQTFNIGAKFHYQRVDGTFFFR